MILDFGNKLKELLFQKDISVPTLAKMTGLNKNTLYSYMRRGTQKVDPAIMQKLAQALGVDVYYFIGTEQPQNITADENKPVYSDELTGERGERDEFLRLFTSLDTENRKRILDLMRALASSQA